MVNLIGILAEIDDDAVAAFLMVVVVVAVAVAVVVVAVNFIQRRFRKG